MELTRSYERVMPSSVLGRYDLFEVRDAAAVLQSTNPQEFDDLVAVLDSFHLLNEDIIQAGGNEGTVAKKLNEGFRSRGWREGRYDERITSTLRLMPYRPAGEKQAIVVEQESENEGYKVDNVHGSVALDVEWNAKDGNLDRDIGAYMHLYDRAIIAVGVVITRSTTDLRELGTKLGRPDFLNTTTTTNMTKLEPRLARGSGGGCPILAIGITARCYSGTGSV